MIRFTKSSITDLEEQYVLDAIRTSPLSGDGKYTFRVYEQFKKRFGIERMLLTTSGTTALEMASLLIDLQPGDEVIVPSFTFSSTANAFMLRGAKPVFCEIRTDTFNLDETKIESLITPKTKAIYTVAYAGVPCEMDTINAIANKYGIHVIDDAAQSVGSYYKGRPSGTLSELSCFSFHETKNYIMGEGGGLAIQDEKYLDRAEILREKGTNRRQVLNGLVDKYTWHDIGSSFLPSDVLAAILCAQMERYDEIMQKRLTVWNTYDRILKPLSEVGVLQTPYIPEHIQHNGHMYNIVLKSQEARSDLINRLKTDGIVAFICYVPLHSAPMGIKFGYTKEMLPITEDLGSRVLRLPLHADMTENDAEMVANRIVSFLSD